MLDRVFRHRLKRKCRHPDMTQIIRDIKIDHQLPEKARLLNFKIG